MSSQQHILNQPLPPGSTGMQQQHQEPQQQTPQALHPQQQQQQPSPAAGPNSSGPQPPSLPPGMQQQQHQQSPDGGANQSPSIVSLQSNVPTSQTAQQMAAASYRPLNVKDALSYLDQVKVQFQSQPDVYNKFLDIMKDFKSQSIDTPGVIDRVSTLFRGHPNLVQGFNTFLPPGYRIECSLDPTDPNPIRVTTPMGTTTRPDGAGLAYDGRWGGSQPTGNIQHQALHQHPQEGLYAPYKQTEPGSAPPNAGQPIPPESAMAHLQAGANVMRQAYSMSEPQHQAMHHRQQQQHVFQPQPAPPPQNPPQPHQPQQQPQQQQQPQPQPPQTSQAHKLEARPGVGGPVDITHAISYVNVIKNRFANQPDIYKSFLEILQTYQREQKPIADVYAQVTILFKDAPDLLADFKQFLPEATHQRALVGPGTSAADVFQGTSRLPPVGSFAPPSSGPKDRKKRSLSAAGSGMNQLPPPVMGDLGLQGYNGVTSPPPGMPSTQVMNQTPVEPDMYIQTSSLRGGPPAAHQPNKRRQTARPDSSTKGAVSPSLIPYVPESFPPPMRVGATTEELDFFDRVKRFISNKQIYSEFLKLLNLFTNEIIDKDTLVQRAELFLGKNEELISWFKNFIGYEPKYLSIEHIVRKKHRLELSLCKSYGPSYRLLPKSETLQPCSGRDELCWEVLNDEWVGHPTWASEDSGFIAHRKNQYEEILHRIEEERHEYDHNIEANLRTIQILEPIANRITNMTAEERAAFKLPPGLGYTSVSIYSKLLKKIYDRERGEEVIEALMENPAVAVPIVLKRLKQKDEEWRRAHREWNKVWRETEARVMWKSLDHRGLTFKQTDKKTLTTKHIIGEIDTILKEQEAKRTSPLALLPPYQLDFGFDDPSVLWDIARLMSSHLEHSSSYSSFDRDRMDAFFRLFLPLFFGDEIGPDPALETQNEDKSSIDEANHTQNDINGEDGNGNDSEPKENEEDGHRSFQNESLRTILTKRALRDKNGNNRSKEKEKEEADQTTRSPSREVNGIENGANAAEDEPAIPPEVEKGSEVWIKLAEQARSALSPNTQNNPRQTFDMFANTTIYCFIRLIQVVYSRLKEIKALEPEVSKDIKSRKPVEFAKELGILPHKIEDMGLAFSPDNCYGQLLDLCERVMEGDLDHPWFEEALRHAYRNRAFKMYTIDKVIQAIAKHAHTIVTDQKSADIMQLFDKYRHLPTMTSRQEIIYRIQVDDILGGQRSLQGPQNATDESMFRISWNEKEKHLYLQRLRNEDLSVSLKRSSVAGTDDLTAQSYSKMDLYNYYVTSFMLVTPTEGVPADKLKRPFLNRNLEKGINGVAEERREARHQEGQESDNQSEDAIVDESSGELPDALVESNMLVRICANTYKMFFEPRTEDVYVRYSAFKKPDSKKEALMSELSEKRKRRLLQVLEGLGAVTDAEKEWWHLLNEKGPEAAAEFLETAQKQIEIEKSKATAEKIEEQADQTSPERPTEAAVANESSEMPEEKVEISTEIPVDPSDENLAVIAETVQQHSPKEDKGSPAIKVSELSGESNETKDLEMTDSVPPAQETKSGEEVMPVTTESIVPEIEKNKSPTPNPPTEIISTQAMKENKPNPDDKMDLDEAEENKYREPVSEHISAPVPAPVQPLNPSLIEEASRPTPPAQSSMDEGKPTSTDGV